MAKTFRVGTRTSPLALRQVEEVLRYLKVPYPDFKAEVVGIDTYGDKDRITPISQIEGGDFFTREIDEALLNGDIDMAVHSAKDLPDRIREGLAIAAQTRPIDPCDCLVSRNNLKIEELPINAKIATSSLRRNAQLRKYRDDFNIVDIRGNTEERLQRLDNSNSGLDAIVIAACALSRLGLEKRITQRLPYEILKPHPLQGALAVVVKAGDYGLSRLLSVIGIEGAYYE